MNVILIVEVEGLNEKTVFEKHLNKEGFTPIPNEVFAYEGNTTTHMFSTRAFILEVVEKGLKKSGFESCRIIFQVGENPMEAYLFDHEKDTFEQVAV
ncbi:hypothetical protein FA592_14155 [Sulfurospirillum diekertiae]|uniref:Uncharacterized protein n=1 Tax=Sulfurospirillum diekertiae TaxID=1854492 RepID=A0A7H1JH08_9BACT|nr:hypothetical protein [Sulfurospirillum diekertiae]QNA70435.1 hypothetical protein FA584_14060 [Sulfurospirillum diekertiae]QNT10482.1 hypothetical protein FA592_14155 [Sulfurospirillum diekertiae]